MSELIALVGETEIGRVHFQRGQLSFVYSDAWRSKRDSFPLSLSMPLTGAEHGNRIVTAYLSNLLPDNSDILRSWRARFGVRSLSPFALLEHVGEECAGAAQYVRPDRVEAVLARRSPEPQWLSEREIGARLRELTVNRAAWRHENDLGQFSLSGAQPKTALLRKGDRWGIPGGRVPTTHIFKPANEELPGHAENEHFCLTLAHRIGLPAANSQVLEFDGAFAIVVTRFDRLAHGKEILRLHAEDFCQALGVPPEHKYEFEGGPGVATSADLLANSSSEPIEDLRVFADALIFNWLIAGTDAHAKNYSLLISPERVRFAPLYDIASVLPYPTIDRQGLRLAMRVGRHYRLRVIQLRHWNEAAVQLKSDPEAVQARIAEFAAMLPDAASEVARDLRQEGLRHPIIARLRDAIQQRVAAEVPPSA